MCTEEEEFQSKLKGRVSSVRPIGWYPSWTRHRSKEFRTKGWGSKGPVYKRKVKQEDGWWWSCIRYVSLLGTTRTSTGTGFMNLVTDCIYLKSHKKITHL